MIIALKHLITELIQRFLVSILAWPDFHLIKELIQRFLVSHPTRPDLPDEILVEIFSRLPPKSIGKCRCLSKTWRSSLSTRQFIKSHLAAQQNQESLILMTPNRSIRLVETIRADCDNTVSREVKLPGLCDDIDDILGSCDGLLLLMNSDEDENKLILANPITQELVELPNIPLIMSLRIIYGLGHDSVHDDYKVVAVCYSFHLPRSGHNVEENVAMVVFVYSVKSGVWTSVVSPCYSYRWPVTASGAFVNGAFHWSTVGKSNDRVIAAFDLANEALFEIPAPSGVDPEHLLSRPPLVLGGCLCAIDARSNVKGGFDVWVMKEYGVPESWTKFSVSGYDSFKPLCFTRGQEEEVVLLVVGPCLVVCNVKDGVLRDFVVDGGFVDGCAVGERQFSYIDGCTFVESLISPLPL